ncbi:MAG: bacillithiol biosynthesis cysteine-adding enzyme BshC [Spirosomaceae bacterium]|jgi:bacillithiol biosynthesis cysteine-adding enzyme BshC|nr:bacillithiol biosynthesis cysteine-adding enzyme BshC [Spirosomataceae bacterium]
MVHQTLPLSATGAFPALFLDYIAQQPNLQPFYENFPTVANFAQQIAQKKEFLATHREVLVRALTRQYAHIDQKPDLNVLLQPNTFTVTTGHQLNIFTGPLYVIYKIVTAINLARQLQAAYPDCRFVPVYWMATEDHDFEEINHFNLFGKKYTWQTQQKGAVGRMMPKELGEALKILPERVPVFEKAYLQCNSLADAVRCYMNDLFGAEGLVCIDGDDPALKQLFAPVIKDELQHQNAHRIVSATTTQIESLGYHTQISPREINLFYLTDGLRERIVAEANGFHVLNTDLHFGEAEMLAQVVSNPERFSPNVVLRPLYQEIILPNLAYIGGPSEVPYWLQLKGIFDHYAVPFPMLLPRNFALYVNQASQKRAEKLGVSVEQLFWDDVRLRKSFVEKTATVSLALAQEKAAIAQVFEQILMKAILIDKTLEGTVNAEKTKTLATLENLEKRLQKAEERNHETEVSQLLGLKNKLFPNGGLQERSENFLNFYLNDTLFLQKLLAHFNPLDFSFNVLTEEEA